MAKQQMLQFVTVGKEMPSKRPPELRAKDFHEIYGEFSDPKAAEQSGRCSQCGVPYCQAHCPLSNNIPDWLRMTAEGRLQEAYDLSQATNTFPEICGRICPQDRLCEGNCVIEQSGHGTVTIGSVEKYITDTAWEQGWVKPIRPAVEREESVGIVGAGPAGLAAADRLRRMGFKVTIYDKYDRAGGLMTYGIPGFKLEKPVVMRRYEQLVDGGVEFVMNCRIGDAMDFAALRGKHDALLIATGVYKARDIKAPGVGLKGIVQALDYLTASNRQSFGDSVPEIESGELNADGKRVVVIGGGDTGSDCIGTSFRQGAKSVTQLEIMPAPPEHENKGLTWPNWPLKMRTSSSQAEGAVREFAVLTTKFEGKDGKVSKLHCVKVDDKFKPLPGTEFTLDAELVLLAMGFVHPVHEGLLKTLGVELDQRGNVRASLQDYRTSRAKIFSAGDMRRGQSLVVWAIREGRQCARSIDGFLMGKTDLPG